MSEYKLKATGLEKAVREAYKKVEDSFVTAFLNEDGSLRTGGVGDAVTGAYGTVEKTVVGSYKKIEDAFVKAFLEKIEEESEEGAGV